MDCVSCEPMLDELRRGDLPARIEAEARSHLASCPSCRATHLRLLHDAQNCVESGPPSRATRVWSALRSLRSVKPPPKLVAQERSPRLTPHGVLLALLSRLAMAPQVAMGTVMLLMVLVGLWSLPQLTRRHTSRFGTSVEAARVHRPTPKTDTTATLASGMLASPKQGALAERDADQRVRLARRAPPPSAAKAAGARKDAAKSAEQARATSDLEQAMQHYRAREYALATPLFSRALVSATGSSEQAKALLHLARAERALGHCDRAVNSYDTLVRVHPGRIEGRAALREGVACYDRLSEHGRAQRLLDQAAASPRLATSAQAIMSQRPASQRAHGMPRIGAGHGP